MLEVEFGPPGEFEVEEVCLVGDDEPAWVGVVLPAMETAPPKSTALLGETMVKVWPKRGAGISPETLTFSACNFFI
jgi:hypothetical protein